MHDIQSEQQRNSQTGIFNGNLLHLGHALRTSQVEKAADLTALYLSGYIAVLRFSGNDSAGREQIELTDFFLYGHPFHQCTHETVHILIPVGRAGPDRRYDSQGQYGQQQSSGHTLTH